MKLLTLEDYQKAGETFGLSIGMWQKNLVKMQNQNKFLKLWKQSVDLH